MCKFIHSQNIKAIAEDIVRLEKVSLNLALVEYRDHPPQEKTFVTRVLNFTSSVQAMKARLDSCSADGGPRQLACLLSDTLCFLCRLMK